MCDDGRPWAAVWSVIAKNLYACNLMCVFLYIYSNFYIHATLDIIFRRGA